MSKEKREKGKIIKAKFKDASDTPFGTLRISTDDAIEAIRKGDEERKTNK